VFDQAGRSEARGGADTSYKTSFITTAEVRRVSVPAEWVGTDAGPNLKKTEYIHSTFNIGRSMFDVH
jgi:hypothetical protein